MGDFISIQPPSLQEPYFDTTLSLLTKTQFERDALADIVDSHITQFTYGHQHLLFKYCSKEGWLVLYHTGALRESPFYINHPTFDSAIDAIRWAHSEVGRLKLSECHITLEETN